MNQFEDFMVRLMPPWAVATDTGRLYQQGKGAVFDRLMGNMAEAIKLRHILTTDMAAVFLLGAERDIELFPGEDYQSYRGRVQGAWDFWRWAGTNTGILIALQQLGYNARIIEHYKNNPARWAEFSIDFIPIEVQDTKAKYGDDTTLYDSDVTYDIKTKGTDYKYVRDVVNKIKAAHTKLIGLNFMLELLPRYNQSFKYNNNHQYSDNRIIIDIS